jgi:hypothetical protein
MDARYDCRGDWSAVGDLPAFFADDSCATGIHRVFTALATYESGARVSQFPIAGSSYESEAGTSFSGVPLKIANLALTNPDPSPDSHTVPPAGGGEIQIPWSIKAKLDVDLGPGTALSSHEGFFDITCLIANDGSGGGGSGGAFDIEVASLNLTGQYDGPGGPIPFTLRESPTKQSLGKHVVTFPGDGTIQVDSFFDIITELSLDGGQTFLPANSALRMDLTGIPEPSTLLLSALGATGLGVVARRRRRCGLKYPSFFAKGND